MDLEEDDDIEETEEILSFHSSVRENIVSAKPERIIIA